MTKKDISKYYTDENVTRLVALQVIIILFLAFFSHHTYLIVILTVDFALRAFTFLPSPVALIAKLTADGLKAEPKRIFAAPKKFAAAIGFAFSLSVLVLLFLNLHTAAYVVGGVLAFFAALEAGFRICAGCYVYNWLIVPIANKRNDTAQNQ